MSNRLKQELKEMALSTAIALTGLASSGTVQAKEAPLPQEDTTEYTAPQQRRQSESLDPFVYAEEHGLVYDRRLSNGLNKIGSNNGDHSGFAGAFVNPETREVIILPNDMLRDKSQTYGSYQAAQSSAKMGIGPWDHSSHNNNGRYYDPDKRRDRRAPATRRGRKAERVIRTVDNVLDIIHTVRNSR